jgi:hypothetical protein
MAHATDLMALQLYNQGVEASSVGNSIAAVKLFERATRLDPTFADAQYNLGVCYFDLRQYDKSAQAFKQVLNRYPNDAPTRQSYQRALALSGQAAPGWTKPVAHRLPPSAITYGQKQATIIHLNNQERLQPIRKPALGYVKPKLTKSQPVLVYQAPAATAVYGNTTLKLKPYTKPAATTPAIKPLVSSAKTGVPVVVSRAHRGPTGIGQGPDNHSVYVANYISNTLYKVNDAGSKTLVTSQGMSGPIGLVWNPTRQEWYVANYKGNSITRIKPDGKATVVSNQLKKPYMLLLDEPRQTLYVTEQETNTVSKIKL